MQVNTWTFEIVLTYVIEILCIILYAHRALNDPAHLSFFIDSLTVWALTLYE